MEISRREFLTLAGITAAGLLLPDCGRHKKTEEGVIFMAAEGIDYIVDNYRDSRIVVGAIAPASDVVGAIDIATALNNEIALRYGSGSMATAKLDTEIMPNPFMYNLISVGNSHNNQVTNLLEGNPNPWDAGLPDEKGVIKFYRPNKAHIALVATGKTELDVRRATSVLADFKNPNYNLNGKVIYVSGPDLNNLTTEIIIP